MAKNRFTSVFKKVIIIKMELLCSTIYQSILAYENWQFSTVDTAVASVLESVRSATKSSHLWSLYLQVGEERLCIYGLPSQNLPCNHVSCHGFQ